MKQTCILVLGMHRSGTSALTGTLNLLDISLGNELLEPKNDNQKGFFENKNIVEINESILESLGAHWHDVLYTPEALSTLDSSLRDTLKKVIIKEFEGSRIFAIKDPRLASLFPLYESILNELSIEIKIIIPYRNPIEVARSLSNRDKFTQEKAILLWTYNILWAEQFSRKYSRVFIEFDELISNTEKSIATISEKLNVKFLEKYRQNRSSIDNFLEPSLKHHNIVVNNNTTEIPNTILKILEVDFNGNISDQFDRLQIEIEAYRKLFYHQEIVDSIKNISNLKERLFSQESRLQEEKEKLHQCNNNLEKDRKELEDVYRLIDEKEGTLSSLKNLIKESEAALQSKNSVLKKSNKELKVAVQQRDEREQKLKEQSALLEQLSRSFQDRESELKELHQMLTKQTQTIAYKELKIQQKEKDLKKSNEMISNREQELEEVKNTIARSHQIMRQQKNRINRLEKELIDLYTSKSWKITRPLRKLARLWK